MEFLLSHWHCIIPAIGIIAAIYFMRDKNKDEKDNNYSNNSEEGRVDSSCE